MRMRFIADQVASPSLSRGLWRHNLERGRLRRRQCDSEFCILGHALPSPEAGRFRLRPCSRAVGCTI